MKITKDIKLFFGCKIDSKLREALHNAKPGDRKYFEDPESGFLQILIMIPPKGKTEKRDEKWIGKLVPSGLGVSEVEDIQRNVVSILRRVAPDTRINPNSVKIFVVDENAVVEEPVRSSDETDDGPYIQY